MTPGDLSEMRKYVADRKTVRADLMLRLLAEIESLQTKLATIDCGDCGHTMLDCQCGAKTSDPGDPRLCSYRVRRSMERLAKVLTPKGGT